MHSKLLHEALQKEETRAIVIEVEEGPEEPGEDEEFYAANFELLGQEEEDEEEGMVSEDEAPPLVDSDEESDEEPSPFAYLGEDRPRLCQQRVPLEVNGNLTSLHTLYDWESPNTLVRKESARRIGLQGVRAPRQAIKGYQGGGIITDCVYYLPLLDVDGNIQVIRAHGVDEIAVVARTRLPPVAREIFPVIRAYMPWMETGAGHVELLIGLDNRQWLPAHVEDSWDPDDDMRLMRSVFGHRYMITDHMTDGEETFSRQTTLGTARQARKEAELSQLMQPRRFDWKSTEDGARAHGAVRTAVCKRLQTREADAWGRAPKTTGGPLARGLPSPRGKQAREAGQWDLAERVWTRRYPRPRSGCHTLRSSGEHGRGPERYHPRRKGRPPTSHPRLVEAAGTEVGRVGEGEAMAERSGHSRRAGSPFPTQEGCRDHCS
jgi:hypothetical protein